MAKSQHPYQWLGPLSFSLLILIVPFLMAYMGYTESRESRFLSSRFAYLASTAARVEARVNNVFTVVRNSFGKEAEEKTVEKKICDPECQKELILNKSKSVLGQNSLGLEAKKLKRLVGTGSEIPSQSRKISRKSHNRITFEINEFSIPAITSILLGELDPNNRFDDVLLFDAEGVAVYQKHPQLGRIGNFSDLEQATSSKDDEDSKELLTDTISTMVRYFQQVEYLVFKAPVNIGTLPQGETWTMVALVSKKKLTSDKLEFPTTELVGFVFLLTLLILSWPFLRIRYFGPYDVVYRHDIWIQVASGCIALALITVVLLQAKNSNQLFSRLDLESRKIGIELADAFIDELKMQVLTLNDNKAELICTNGGLDPCTNGNFKSQESSILAKRPGQYRSPLLKMLYLMDEDGNQKVKWSTSSVVTPPGNFADREYFQRALPKNKDSLYTIKSKKKHRDSTPEANETEPKTPEEVPDFFVDVIESRTTGEQSVVISMPADCKSKPAVSVDADGDAERQFPCVIVMSSDIWSMKSAVPFGFGYAVVDKTGTVLFNSSQDSSQQLKLFEEIDDPDQLIVALDVGHGAVTAEYQGSEHRFHIQPIDIDGAEWTLVTYYNKDLYELFLLETTGAVAAAWGVWFGIFLLIAACYMLASYALKREHMVAWLNRITLRNLTVYLLPTTILIAAFCFMEFGLFASILFIPFLLLAIRQMSRNRKEIAFMSTTVRHGCLVVAMLFFMLFTAVLPVLTLHESARELTFNFIVNAQHIHQYSQREIQNENQSKWKANTRARPEDEIKAMKHWKTFTMFPDYTRADVNLGSINCPMAERGRLFTWLCESMSKLPIYSEEATQIRPAYHLDLLDEQELMDTYEEFYAQYNQPVGAMDIVRDAMFILLLITLLAIFVWRWSVNLMGLQISNLTKGAALLGPLPSARLHQIVYGMAERTRWVFADLVGVERIFMLDFRRATVKSSVAELLQGAKDAHDVVVVDHFDELIKDPELVKLRVELLEFLLHETEVSIFVVASMDILSYLNQRLIVDQDLDSKLIARLAVVLSYFSRHYYDEKSPNKPADDATSARKLLHAECFHPNLQDILHQVEQDPLLNDYIEQQIVNLVLARARAMYQVMWDVCSHVEKFTLIQLSHDRPVNPNNWEVAQKLKQRGYLRRDPNYRIFNKSFELFIQSVEPIEDMVAWQSEVTSTWDRIKIPVLVLVIFGLAFLAITQPGFFNSLFAWVAAAGAALPIILRFFGTWWASRAVSDSGSK